MSREAIFSSTDFSEYLLTISYTDSKLYFDLKIQSTAHNSSTIISAEYFTSVDMIVRMITVNSISAAYNIGTKGITDEVKSFMRNDPERNFILFWK